MRETAKDKGRLQHILSSIERVQEFTKGMSKEELVNDTHNLEVPGSSPGWSTLKIKHLQSFCRCFFFYR